MAITFPTRRSARVRNFLSGFLASDMETALELPETAPLISLRERRERLEVGPYGPVLPFIQPQTQCARPTQCRNGGVCRLSI